MASSGPGTTATRWWRRLRRRPVGVQIGTLVIVVVVVVGVIVGVTVGSSSHKGGSTPPVTTGTTPANVVNVDQASTSSRGVTATTINVVFPVSNLTSLSSNFGFAGDKEFGAQTAAIHTFVNAINKAGGINGRMINPMIVDFDPTNEAEMRALCEQWTKGSPPVFAVVDGIGAWDGDNQLCITQEGHTPFIGQWTTVTNWTQEGSPYLWWTGPDQASILSTVVAWAKGAGLIGGGKKVAIVVGDRASDQTALNDYLLPDFERAGIPAPMVETIPAGVTDSASTNAAAPLIVQRLQSAGIQSVLPLMPFNAFFPYLQAETQEGYFPKLLLSDYESSIDIGLGLIPIPYEKALDGQEGVTVETLGGTDAPIPESEGGYDPGVESCYKTWKAHNKPVSTVSPYIEEQGPIAGWCQGVRLFAAAATKAGRDLNRRTFVEAMASIKDFQGTYSPTLSFGPDKFAGPNQYQVVALHNNVPPSKLCVLTYKKKPQGTCWHVVQSWRPLVTS